jgi:hypothetical protein
MHRDLRQRVRASEEERRAGRGPSPVGWIIVALLGPPPVPTRPIGPAEPDVGILSHPIQNARQPGKAIRILRSPEFAEKGAFAVAAESVLEL